MNAASRWGTSRRAAGLGKPPATIPRLCHLRSPASYTEGSQRRDPYSPMPKNARRCLSTKSPIQKSVEEFIRPWRISHDLTLGEGVNARTLNIQLKPFTPIGATTHRPLVAPCATVPDGEHLTSIDRGTGNQSATRENCSSTSPRTRPRKSPAAAEARHAWPTIACAGSATTQPAGRAGRSRAPWPRTP